jgi:hypothetical protein
MERPSTISGNQEEGSTVPNGDLTSSINLCIQDKTKHSSLLGNAPPIAIDEEQSS